MSKLKSSWWKTACAVVVLCAAAAIASSAQQPGLAPAYTLLHVFAGSEDGSNPLAALIRDSSGNLYGTTYYGGNVNQCGSGCGVVFRLSPNNGQETGHYSFFGGPDDAANPVAPVIRDPYGNLYGTTYDGARGFGAVFKVTLPATETLVYTFTGGADGAYPYGGLVRDSSGNLYGTTALGGTYGFGVVFMVSPAGQESVLHSFTGGADGGCPAAGLIRDSAGNLYGTTFVGGAGNGVVFKLTPAGQETVLYTFTGGADGAGPTGSLIQDSSGNFYSTTLGGGAFGVGVVFELSSGGSETVLYSFTGGPDGSCPAAALVRDRSGNLYGTTRNGGDASACTYGCGVVFKVASTGQETVLHTFSGKDGATPYSSLVLDSSGNLYGTTEFGGHYSTVCPLGCGVAFKLTQR
jgi:uncharacterized repeat protein (TIGR03803 family)